MTENILLYCYASVEYFKLLVGETEKRKSNILHYILHTMSPMSSRELLPLKEIHVIF